MDLNIAQREERERERERETLASYFLKVTPISSLVGWGLGSVGPSHMEACHHHDIPTETDLILDLTNKTQLVILCAFHQTGCPEIYRKGRDESETRIADSGTCVGLHDKTKERRWKN
uniref:Uncharacterized protein n=1 Tax=Populus davidiana TaxID=266767 RepID=A0A6M2E7P4_9ROSI